MCRGLKADLRKRPQGMSKPRHPFPTWPPAPGAAAGAPLALPPTCTTNPAASTASLFAEPIPTRTLPNRPEIKLWPGQTCLWQPQAQQRLGSQRSGSVWPSRRPWAGEGRGGKCWLQACTWVLPRQLITCPSLLPHPPLKGLKDGLITSTTSHTFRHGGLCMPPSRRIHRHLQWILN